MNHFTIRRGHVIGCEDAISPSRFPLGSCSDAESKLQLCFFFYYQTDKYFQKELLFKMHSCLYKRRRIQARFLFFCVFFSLQRVAFRSQQTSALCKLVFQKRLMCDMNDISGHPSVRCLVMEALRQWLFSTTLDCKSS